MLFQQGDELGRTQRGNNNAYAQDNELTWVDWASADWALAECVGSISRFRIGTLTGGTYRTSAPADAASLTFTLRPIGSGRSVTFPLGMDVLLAAGADSGTDTFTYTVTATFL